ncbi:DUF6286 domain-containing protein [Streptomyces sp. NPDC088261]|uniref:DUF6286 domain-containing protein n=1 Tax=Streptomyces sp. NPDC088261 TaxID=3365851 RepID=UPI0037F1C638
MAKHGEGGGAPPVGGSVRAAGHELRPSPDGATVSGGRAGRFWSARRIPAAIAAAIILGAAGLVLYDVAAVRAGHHAMYWRRRLAEELAEQPLDETWLMLSACVAMALGVWLMLLALTPGLRALLPMRRDFGHVRAGLDRSAAAQVLRDRAMEVSGVRSARVRVRRRKARVRALSHFRELDDVRADLDSALGAGLGELGLARPLALSVRVRRPKKKG